MLKGGQNHISWINFHNVIPNLDLIQITSLDNQSSCCATVHLNWIKLVVTDDSIKKSKSLITLYIVRLVIKKSLGRIEAKTLCKIMKIRNIWKSSIMNCDFK